MILMSIYLDNFFQFNKFSLNFSYPKKIVRTPLDDEFLPGHPRFRYKKLVVVMGANATGKTTLGKAVSGIFSFIGTKDPASVARCICDPRRDASFRVEFVTTGGEDIFCRVDAVIRGTGKTGYPDIRTRVMSVPVKPDDTYESCRDHVAAEGGEAVAEGPGDAMDLDAVKDFGRFFICTDGGPVAPPQPVVQSPAYAKALKAILQTEDPSIIDVVQSDGNGYLVKAGSNELVIKDGRVIGPDVLSSGTKEGIGIAAILASMRMHLYDFYYCDGCCSHAHSDLESGILALMVGLLGEKRQLFFTTRNSDVLDMDLPKHTFLFLRKGKNKEISAIAADKVLKRNTDVLRNAVENDVFLASPDLTLLDELEEGNG